MMTIKIPHYSKLLHIFFFLFSCATQQVFAQTAPPSEPAKPASKVQTLDELKAAVEKVRQETNTPAVGIALVNKDEVSWVAGLGQSNLEKKIKADENTLFRIASTSKMFIGLAVLKLVEEGKLHLDDKVQTLAPEISFQNKWEASHPVLLAHLLEHTTGWDDMHPADFGFDSSDTLDSKDGLAFHPHSRVSRWVPGTRMAYCSTGTVVAAYIVEKISGKKFEDYVQENFFKPLQMPTTSYFESDAVKKSGATLYSKGVPQGYQYHLYRPDGALNTSAKEMVNFLRFLVQRGRFDDQTLLSTASFDRMEKGTSTLGAAKGLRAGYGLTSMSNGFDGYKIPFYGHQGRVVGGVTDLFYAPSLQQGYVIMLNTDNYEALDRIVDLVRQYVLRDSQKKTVADLPMPAEFKKLNGWYRLINPRNEISRFVDDITNLSTFEVEGKYLLRSTLFDGITLKAQAMDNHLLMDANSGLAAVAIVNDPLEGEVIQVRNAMYKSIPGLYFWGLIIALGSWAVFALLNMLMVAVTVVRRILRKTSKANQANNIKLIALPMLATFLIILAKFSGAIFGEGDADWGQVSATSVTTMICSLAYAVVSLYCLWLAIRQIRQQAQITVYWHAYALSLLHGLMVVYLAWYGIIGIRTWAY